MGYLPQIYLAAGVAKGSNHDRSHCWLQVPRNNIVKLAYFVPVNNENSLVDMLFKFVPDAQAMLV